MFSTKTANCEDIFAKLKMLSLCSFYKKRAIYCVRELRKSSILWNRFLELKKFCLGLTKTQAENIF
ncbi:MAG: hypothetical protein D6687_09235 [Acidobacteria bacterium]|nr:MAG: hypothetical protein D6687_09235 [Acidobacteriota bacterium]